MATAVVPRVPPGFDSGTPCHSTPAEITRPYNRMFSLQFASRVLLFLILLTLFPRVRTSSRQSPRVSNKRPNDCSRTIAVLGNSSRARAVPILFHLFPRIASFFFPDVLIFWVFWSLGHHGRRTGSPLGDFASASQKGARTHSRRTCVCCRLGGQPCIVPACVS